MVVLVKSTLSLLIPGVLVRSGYSTLREESVCNCKNVQFKMTPRKGHELGPGKLGGCESGECWFNRIVIFTVEDEDWYLPMGWLSVQRRLGWPTLSSAGLQKRFP